jgi:hypothetical protein
MDAKTVTRYTHGCTKTKGRTQRSNCSECALANNAPAIHVLLINVSAINVSAINAQALDVLALNVLALNVVALHVPAKPTCEEDVRLCSMN